MCYAEPLTGAIIATVVWRQRRNSRVQGLALLLWGGALFGLLDHLWNGELFHVPKNLGSDLMLGAVITMATVSVWGLSLLLSPRSDAPAAPARSEKAD